MANEAFKQLTGKGIAMRSRRANHSFIFFSLFRSVPFFCHRLLIAGGVPPITNRHNSLSASLSLFTSHHPLYCLPPSLLPLSFCRILHLRVASFLHFSSGRASSASARAKSRRRIICYRDHPDKLIQRDNLEKIDKHKHSRLNHSENTAKYRAKPVTQLTAPPQMERIGGCGARPPFSWPPSPNGGKNIAVGRGSWAGAGGNSLNGKRERPPSTLFSFSSSFCRTPREQRPPPIYFFGPREANFPE